MYKRYPVGWQCGSRNVWIICEEWRKKLSWIWAPREEKVNIKYKMKYYKVKVIQI